MDPESRRLVGLCNRTDGLSGLNDHHFALCSAPIPDERRPGYFVRRGFLLLGMASMRSHAAAAREALYGPDGAFPQVCTGRQSPQTT